MILDILECAMCWCIDPPIDPGFSEDKEENWIKLGSTSSVVGEDAAVLEAVVKSVGLTA